MNVPNRLTRHARLRLAERTSLSQLDFLALLDQHRTVAVGRGHPCTLRHQLFYSVADAAHFIAVHDAREGWVITILPLAYYEGQNRGRLVPEQQKRRAIRHVLPDGEPAPVPFPPPPPLEQGVLLFFSVLVGATETKLTLGSYRFYRLPATPQEALTHTGFIAKFRTTLAAAHMDPAALIALTLSNRTLRHRLRIECAELAALSPEFLRSEIPAHTAVPLPLAAAA